MDKRKDNVIVKLTFEFALEIIQFVQLLEDQRKFVIAKQLLKSGTSIGANVREAQNAESRADFIHKMKIAIKETEETEYWLELINASENYPKNKSLAIKLHAIDKILTTIISSAKNNAKNISSN